MSPATGCPKCGAPAEGSLCRFCGSLFGEAGAPEAELRAVDEFHDALGTADAEARKRLLTSGFIPDTVPGLIEAGVMCIPLCRDGDTGVADAALNRLEAVVLKLELARETTEGRKALAQFRTVIEERRKQARSDTFLGCTLLVGLTALLAVLAVYIVHRILQ